MNKPMPAKGGSASGGNNLDSINRQNLKQSPKIAISSKPQQVNLLMARQDNGPKRIFKKILVLIILAVVILGSVALLRASSLSEKIFVGQKTTFLGKIFDLIRGGGDNDVLIGEDLGQINVLLLGVGGAQHDGPLLTDTMIVAQIRPDIGEAVLVSIPRDYLVDLPQGGGQDKINSAFTYGWLKHKDWDEAGAWARQSVENISGLKIPYFAVVDFSGFTKAVDLLGGLDINVERNFTDSTYPDSGTGYLPPITFTEGQQQMDGKTALQFARSRHGDNNEGSDFARSLRQQKILEAFKHKILSLNIIKDINSINKLLNILADHFHTNVSPAQALRMYNLIKSKDTQISSLSLDPETDIICPRILASNGAYVLVPCESEDDVKSFFKNSFAAGRLAEEKSIVWLANSTTNTAAYNTASRKLTTAGLTVYQLNYTRDNLPSSIVYAANSKPSTVEFIKNELKATQASLPPPGVNVSPDKVDVIVVLGQNAPVEAPPKPYIPPPAREATSTAPTASSTPTATSTKPK